MPVDAADPRFARQRALAGFGPEAQQRLAEARVVVIGAGGLGSAVLPLLAAAGVGAIEVWDDDTVEASNLHRQTLHSPADVGRPKAESALDALTRLAPDTELVAHVARFAPKVALDAVLDADLLVDASDDPTTRYLANDIAAVRGIPLVWGNAIGWAGQVGVAWDARGVDYRDLFPEPDPAADSCETQGVLPSVCGVIGAAMASEALKVLTGSGEPLVGRALLYDARTGGTREVAYRRDPDAPRVGSVDDLTAEKEPDRSRIVEPAELRALLDGDAPPMLLDVRHPHEFSFAHLEGATLIPLDDLPSRIDELDREAPIVVYCHHGMRSGRALDLMTRAGFTRAKHLNGGIDRWAREVDPALPRY
ncbi:MAG: ThiF family adenylyltransferase [Actinomycetales bacterium]|nr:ThiF family adenylyltransferase [Actinomycetales bacterium]